MNGQRQECIWKCWWGRFSCLLNYILSEVQFKLITEPTIKKPFVQNSNFQIVFHTSNNFQTSNLHPEMLGVGILFWWMNIEHQRLVAFVKNAVESNARTPKYNTSPYRNEIDELNNTGPILRPFLWYNEIVRYLSSSFAFALDFMGPKIELHSFVL